MASYSPSKILGLQNKEGCIEVDKYTNMIAINEDINIYETIVIVKGRVAYNRL